MTDPISIVEESITINIKQMDSSTHPFTTSSIATVLSVKESLSAVFNLKI